MNVQTFLLMTGLILVAALLVAAIALRSDSRQTRLERRVDTYGGSARGQVEAGETPRSIRANRARRAPLAETLYSVVLRIPAGLPQVHLVPVWVVLAAGAAVGAVAGWGATFILPLALCALGGLVVGVLVARFIFSWETEHYREKLLKQMPDAIELVTSAVRAGLPVSEAFRSLAREMQSPTRDEFAQMVSEISLGALPDEALMNAHRRTQVTEYAIFAVTLAVQMRSGGRLTESIQNLAETIRQRLAVGQRAHALAAEAKLSARVISVLPFVGGGLMMLLQPGSLGPLFHEPRGKQMIAFASVALVLGMLSMRRIIRGVTRE